MASSSAQYSMRNFSASRDRGVGGERFGASHDVDGVDVELAGDAGGLLVLAVGEHPDAGYEDDQRVGTSHRRGVGRGVTPVVGGVVGAVALVELGELLVGGVAGDDERLHLGAQEVVGARGAELDESVERGTGEEVEHDVGVGEVAHHPLVARGDGAKTGCQRGRLCSPLGRRERPTVGHDGAEGLRVAVGVDVGLGGVDDPAAVRLGFEAGGAPRGDAVAAEDAADRLGVGRRTAAMSRPSWNPGRRHGIQTTALAVDHLRERFAVGGRRDGDATVGVEVVDVGRGDEPVHRRVDGGRRAPAPVQAVVERGNHLVLPVLAGVDVDQGAEPVEAQHRQPLFAEGAKVAAGALHPQQLDIGAGGGVDLGALRRGVAPGVVGVPGVGAEPVRPVEELSDDGVHAPHPAWSPPTRSSTMRSAYPLAA